MHAALQPQPAMLPRSDLMHACYASMHAHSEARVGGMLSGKAGLVHVHTGAGPSQLQPLLEACDLSDVPITQFLPTHMERNKSLVAAGVDWMKKGGFCDFTAGAEVRWTAHLV